MISGPGSAADGGPSSAVVRRAAIRSRWSPIDGRWAGNSSVGDAPAIRRAAIRGAGPSGCGAGRGKVRNISTARPPPTDRIVATSERKRATRATASCEPRRAPSEAPLGADVDAACAALTAGHRSERLRLHARRSQLAHQLPMPCQPGLPSTSTRTTAATIIIAIVSITHQQQQHRYHQYYSASAFAEAATASIPLVAATGGFRRLHHAARHQFSATTTCKMAAFGFRATRDHRRPPPSFPPPTRLRSSRPMLPCPRPRLHRRRRPPGASVSPTALPVSFLPARRSPRRPPASSASQPAQATVPIPPYSASTALPHRPFRLSTPSPAAPPPARCAAVATDGGGRHHTRRQ